MKRTFETTRNEDRLLRAKAARESARAPGPDTRPGGDRGSLLGLQRTIGNRAVTALLQRNLSARAAGTGMMSAGLLQGIPKGAYEEDEPIPPGMAPEETSGLPAAGVAGVQRKGEKGAKKPVAVEVTAEDRIPPTYLYNKAVTGGALPPQLVAMYRHDIAWKVPWWSSGWLVQEIKRKDAYKNAGQAEQSRDQHYWEAWKVDWKGKVTPSSDFGNGKVNDIFTSPVRKNATGNWHIDANVYHTKELPDAGFAAGAVKSAGVLLATESDPGDMGPLAHHRSVGGKWNTTGEKVEHVPD